MTGKCATLDTTAKKGSESMSQCGPGFYRSDSTVQAAVNQTSCTLCESGYYCDNAGMSETDMKANECPKGSYCAPGSLIPEKCDVGTYGSGITHTQRPFMGNYSWGKIVFEERTNTKSFDSYNDNGVIGISTSGLVQRTASLKFKNYT